MQRHWRQQQLQKGVLHLRPFGYISGTLCLLRPLPVMGIRQPRQAHRLSGFFFGPSNMTTRRAASRKDYDGRRGTAHERGYTSAWQGARDGHLRSHPLCAEHERRGEIEAAAIVDHIKAPKLRDAIESGDADRIAEARALFWDRTNWQSLCKFCHDSIKQRFEKSGRVAGCGPDGRPLDGGHHWNRSPGGCGG